MDIRVPHVLSSTIRALTIPRASSIRGMAPRILAADEAILSVTDGFSLRNRGMTSSLITLRLTSATRLELSVTYCCPSVSRYAVISSLLTQSSGRHIRPFLGFMPAMPFSPVPRTRFMRTVSAQSSLWWATQTVSAPISSMSLPKYAYLNSLAPISTLTWWREQYVLVSKCAMWRGMSIDDVRVLQKFSSRSLSSPRRWKLQ